MTALLRVPVVLPRRGGFARCSAYRGAQYGICSRPYETDPDPAWDCRRRLLACRHDCLHPGTGAAAGSCGRRLPQASAGRPAVTGDAAEALPAAARLRDRAGAGGPRDRGPGRRHVRRQRPDVRPRDALLHAGRRRIEFPGPGQPHLASRGYGRRRHLRSPYRVRRLPGPAADRDAAPGRRAPRPRNRQPRPLQVQRHRRRRRRRHAREVLRRLRPRHQHGVAAGRHGVGARQLDVLPLQPVPHSHRAGRQGAA